MNGNSIDFGRLLSRVRQLGSIGRDKQGRLTRLAASSADGAARDLVAGWMHDAGLEVAVDRVGNFFGIWRLPGHPNVAPVMVGSHIDTVVNAGIYDGSYGVLSGLEVIMSLQDCGYIPTCPIAVAAFTNEKGARYAPDMMGSLVHAGDLPVEEALVSIGIDGSVLGLELARIGYAGSMEPGTIRPRLYLELHVEQGPVLERSGLAIGAVEHLQGIAWQRITVDGMANHAGTTPMRMRRDAGLAAARITTFLRDRIVRDSATSVATVGTIHFEPNIINVIPSRATFTVDFRDPEEKRLREMEDLLAAYLAKVADADGVSISAERLARFEPIIFDSTLVTTIEDAAKKRNLSYRRMISGAGHDAQMMARVCPTAMIFVPSVKGISHSPDEFTTDKDLENGANVLLDVVTRLTGERS
jgi:N-carbamoyl-L-amino-acid hydrolase